MEIAIIVLAGLAVYHFVYEGILAPSFRLKLRFELFELRDELRKLKISHAEDLRDEIDLIQTETLPIHEGS